MNLETNGNYLNSIKKSKVNRERISFTFRSISTFIKDGIITGQGSSCKNIWDGFSKQNKLGFEEFKGYE